LFRKGHSKGSFFGQLDLLNQAAGGEETPEFEFEFISCYVEGLGLVKTSSEVSGYTTGISLSDSSLID